MSKLTKEQELAVLAKCGITPSMIDASQHFWAAFDHSETEVSARYIVRMLQAAEGDAWRPFTEDEIQAFYNRFRPNERYTYNHLRNPPPWDSNHSWVIVLDDGRLSVTLDFVIRCFKSSPKVDAA